MALPSWSLSKQGIDAIVGHLLRDLMTQNSMRKPKQMCFDARNVDILSQLLKRLKKSFLDAVDHLAGILHMSRSRTPYGCGS